MIFHSSWHLSVILAVAISDLAYGCFVSPFFVENYVRFSWEGTLDYCRFYTFYFTFHDLFAPLCLICLSCYISLKFTGKSHGSLSLTNPPLLTGVTAEMKWKRQIYIGVSIAIVVLSLILAVPATVQAAVFQDLPPGGEFKKECRSWDVYTVSASREF